MAVGTQSDFRIYEDEFYTGQFEVNQQVADIFNERSRGAIIMQPRIHEGNKTSQAFFQKISNLAGRRNPTSTGNATSKKLTSDDNNWPKVFGTIGPIENTLNSLKAIASDEREFSRILGQMAQQDKLADMLNTGILVAVTAISTGTEGTNFITNTAEKIDYNKLVDLNALFGDRSGRIVTYVGHSKQIHDLTKESFTIEIENVAGATILGNATPSLGRALIMTDSANLKEAEGASTSPDVASFKLLGLTPGAIRLIESEEDELASEIVTGLDNLTIRIQGEYTFTVEIKGYDFTGTTPVTADSALSTVGNWNQTATDFKDTAGVYFESR